MSNEVDTINNSTVRDGTYLPTLDGWRAIAIMLVVIAHGSDSISNSLITIGINFDFSRIKGVGLFGVQIFFGLSGLLITSRLMASERKYGSISLQSFYIRRAFRILPAALAFLLVVGILALSGIIPITLGRWLSTLFIYANYSTATSTWYLGHFWSLAVEEHFYMIWPAVFLILGISQRRIKFAITIALLLAFWRALDFKFQITGATAAMFWGRTDIEVDNILWGVVVALLYGEPIWKARLNRLLKAPTVLLGFIIFLIASFTFPSHEWKLAFILITIKAIVIPLVILGTLINASELLFYVLETSILKIIGRASYSIYLWQQLFLVWNKDVIQSFGTFQSLPVNILAVFACAIFSMQYIEKPLIVIGHRIASKVI